MKHIVITGGSGGIGGAVAKRFLEHGWHVHLLLRSFDNPEVQEMMKLPNTSVYKSDPGDEVKTVETLRAMKNDGVAIDFVFHAAGTFLWDDGFPKQKRSFEEVREILLQSNVATKVALVQALEIVYADSLGNITQAFIGSHAAHFAVDGPERNGVYKEEAYVESMQKVEGIAKELLVSKKYKDILLFEPGLVNTGLNEAFTEERIGFTVDWSTVPTGKEYAETIFPEEFFKTGQ